METMQRRIPFAATLLLLALAMPAQAATVTDNFNSSRNYLSAGVIGSIWDGVYLGAGAFTNTSTGAGPGSTLICDANLSSNNTLTVQSTQTDWEFADDDGFFLFKNVSGDFSAWVHIVGPFDNGAFNTAGLMVRATSKNGVPLAGSENYISLTRFNQFGIGNYLRNEVNGATDRYINPDGANDANPNYWLRIDRVNGTSFNFYVAENGPAANDWVEVTGGPAVPLDRPEFAGLPLQVGLIHATFDNGATPRMARFEQFSLTGPNVGLTAGEAGAATGLTIATNAGSGKLVLSWTPGTGSDGSVVVVRAGPITDQPVDGTVYTGNPDFGAGDNLSSGNYVVFAGSGSTVTVNNLSGAFRYSMAVYSYVGSGASINYSLGSPATTSAVPPANLLGINLRLPSTLQTNGFAQAVVMANFDSGSAVNVSATATYQTSAANVLTVSAAGQVAGVSATIGASATITASYQGLTSSQPITLVGPRPAVIEHRYSFNSDANDSVGSAHGILMNAAAIGGGEVVLPNATVLGSGDASGAYVDLPNNIVTNLTAVTFEAWVTDNGSANWGRLFDFGNSAGGENVANGGARYMFLSVPGAGVTQTRAAYAYTGTTETGHQLTWTTANGGRPQIGKKTHLVLTTDAETRRGVLYVDGVLVAVSTTFTNSPASIGPTVNNWLARSQFNDPYWYGSIDEFRIWSNALPALQVAANAATGPDNIVADLGALQSVTLLANASMNLGASQIAGLSANYANISNVNVTALAPAFTSDNTNVVTVIGSTRIQAVGLGTANLQASFGGLTASKAITVVAVPPPVLSHRYSFNTDASDSVGSAHGTLEGSAAVANGQLVLDGAGSVTLPPGLISGYAALTIESWVDLGNQVAPPVYLFNLGDTAPNGAAMNYVRLTPQSAAAGNSVLTISGPVINSGVPVGGAVQNVTVGTVLHGKQHLAAVIDPPQRSMRLYVNGRVFNTNAITVQLSSLNNAHSFIGQSLAAADTGLLIGAIDEFRIYSGALTLEQIRTSLAAGPANALINEGTITSLNLSVAPVMIHQTRQLPTVTGSSATVATIDLTRVPGVTLASSDTNVISVMADGRIVANSPGAATLTAGFGPASSSKTVRVAPKQTALMHRYSFDSGPNGLGDSVAGANAQAWGHVGTNGTGGVFLDGTRSTYVELPPYIVDAHQTFTVEAWASTLPTTPTAAWTRLFDFGNSTIGAGGNQFAYFTPNGGGAAPFFTRIAISTPPAGGEQGASTAAGTSLDGTGMRHVVATFQTDPAEQRYVRVYVDNVLTITNSTVVRSMTNVNDDFNFIGRSLFAADNYLTGVIDELRLYYGALTPGQVAANFAAGPDGAPAVGPLLVPVLDVALSGGNAVVTWSDALSGFTLKSTGQLGSGAVWNPVTTPPPSGGFYTVTVPITGGAQFFRLEK